MIRHPIPGVSRKLQQATHLKDAIRELCSAATARHFTLGYPEKLISRTERGGCLEELRTFIILG